MDEAHASEVTAPPVGVTYAGFWRRAAASLLDGSLAQLLMNVLRAAVVAVFALRIDLDGSLAALAAASPDAPAEELSSLVMSVVLVLGLWFLLGAVVHVTYFALQEGSRRSATVGKRVASLRVLDAVSFLPVSRRRAATRTLAKLVSLAPLGLGYLAMLWHPQKRCWHDRISGTVVVLVSEDAGERALGSESR